MNKYSISILFLIVCFVFSCQNGGSNSAQLSTMTDCDEYKVDFRRVSKKHFYKKMNSFRRDNKMELTINTDKLDQLGLNVYTKKMKNNTNRKYSVSVLYNFIKEKNYYANLYSVMNKELKKENLKYVLKTYNNNGEQIGHLDLAGSYDGAGEDFGGEITCDNKIYVYNYSHRKLREYQLDNGGGLELLDTRSIHER